MAFFYQKIERYMIEHTDDEKIQSLVSHGFSHHNNLIGVNVYEHLQNVLRYLFEYRPREPHKIFEGLSNKLFQENQELKDNDQEASYLLVQRQHALLSTIQDNAEEAMTNMLELGFLCAQIGIGINKDEIYWYINALRYSNIV